MFRALEIDPEGRVTSRNGDADEYVRPPAIGRSIFIDCVAPTAEELQTLQERFGFHPLAIEDCAQYDQRPKFEPYDDHLFVVIHSLRPDPTAPQQLDARELHAFLSSNYLVTVHDQAIESIDLIWRRLQQEPGLARRGIGYAYFLLADTTTTSVFPWLEELIDRIETAEDQLMVSPSEAALTEAYTIRRLLASIRRVLAPQREVFSAMSKFESPILGKKLGPFYRSVHDDVLRLTELVETAREHVANLREAHTTAMSLRTNAIVHRLTVLSAVFLPLTFLTGFFGQNFEALPFSSKELFFTALTLTLATPTGMLYWFRRRGWW
jgi:magnesium transporter